MIGKGAKATKMTAALRGLARKVNSRTLWSFTVSGLRLMSAH